LAGKADQRQPGRAQHRSYGFTLHGDYLPVLEDVFF